MRIKRRVVCAAIKVQQADVGHVIIAGPRHFDMTMHGQISQMRLERALVGEAEQGFIDQWGEFMNREEALQVAIEANQLKEPKSEPKDKLFSEDLY